MKRKIFTFLAAILALFVLSTNMNAQAVGDYGSTKASGTAGTMNWFTGTWYVCTTAGTWAGATTTTTPPTNLKNVWILAGDSVVISSGTAGTLAKCLNLEIAGKLNQVGTQVENSQCYGNLHVASTGVFYARQKYIFGNVNTAAESLTVDAGGKMLTYDQFRLQGANGYATTITNNGVLGATTAVANGSATIYVLYGGNTNVIFTGTGTTIFRALLADTSCGSCNFTIDQNMTFCPASGSAAIKMQNSSGVGATTARSVTINAGKTVTITSGGWFANTATTSAIDANNTYNINGTLDVSAGSMYFGCTSNTTAGQQGATNSQIINIGSTGVFKCGTIVSVNKPQATQTLAINVATGGKLTYAGTAYQTFPTASTFAVTTSPYALLTNSNSKLSFSSASATTLTLNTGLVVGDSLSLAAATTLTGASNLTVNGRLSLGGKLTNNSGNLTLGSSAIYSGTSANYIDLATNNGSLTRNGVSSSSTLFPIGTASSYTPLTLVNTTGAPNITTKIKTTIDNAVQDATKVVNLQWSVVGNTSSSSDITFQFNGANKAASFNAAATCELGNYTSSWTATNVNTPSGTDPYTVSVTGLTIPTITNLYVIGNTGNVVRTAPTTSTWSGAIDTNWATTANWDNGVPDNTLDAIIPASLSNYPVISGSQTIKSLTVASGASITNSGTLNIVGQSISINGSLAGNGSFVLLGTDVQTITGVMSVNNLVLNNSMGIVNNGTLTVNSGLSVIGGGVTGTAPVYATDLPVSFTGSGTSSTGLILSPSLGNVGTLTINALGSLNLTAAGSAKDVVLTSGTLNNSSNNLTVTNSVTRSAGVFAAAPVYSGSIPVYYTGTVATTAGYEITPTSGSISVITLNGSDVYTISSTLTTTGSINVASGTLKMAANISAQNITVATGATFNSDNTATTTARHTLTLGNGTADNDAILTVNGVLGNGTKWTNDGIDIEISANAKTFTVNGTGTIGISGMRPANNANSRTLDVTINNSMYLDRDNGGAANIEPALTLQNGTGTYARTLTIPAGVTVAFRGNGGFHGIKNAASSTDELVSNYASSSSSQGNCSYIINGTLDLSYYAGSVFNLNTCSFAGSTQSVMVNVKRDGTLKLGNIVKMYNALSGQYCGIVADSASNVIFNSTSTQYNLLTGGGTVPAFTFHNLIINNSNGVSFPSSALVKGNLTMTTGNITGSSVVMGGTIAQTISSNGNSIENLTINNAVGVTGAPTVTNTLYLTNGVLSDFSNLSNATLVFNGTSAQTIGAGLTAVKNLTINNAAGVSLASDPTISGVLNILNGKLFLGNHNLTMGLSGSISLATSDNYLVTNGTGLLVMNAPAATSTIFPVGTSTTYNPVTLNPASTATFYVGANNSITPALPLSDATIVPANTINRTWNISTSTPSATTVTFGYNGATDNNSGFDNSGQVSLLQYDGSAWKYVGSGSVTPGIGVTTAKTATLEGIGSFAAFTLANPGSGAVYTNTSGSTFSDIFRTTGNGNWGSSSLWELYDATFSTWSSTVLSPTSTSTVTIQAGDTVTITTAAGVGNLTIESGAVLKSSVSAYTSTPIVLTIGKASSVITNNGLFGCPIGSTAGTVGDGIALALGSNCVSFLLIGTGNTGIGSLYALAGSNNLSAVISQDVQFRYSTSSADKTALTLVDPSGAAFTGSRNLLVSSGKTVSFLNGNSCLHGTAFSSAGSYSEQQGNISYDFQGILDLKGGNVYITSSTNAASSAQIVKLNVGAAGKLIVGGDFSICKVQATQAVYANLEDGALLDASSAPTSAVNFYGPSTNSTSGYGSNYVWIITNGNSNYKRLCGTGSLTKTFNVAVTPSNADYVNMSGNPVAIGTGTSDTDVYTVNVNVGQPYSFTSFSPAYAINRTWFIKPDRTVALGTYLKFGFTGSSVDGNASFSATFASVPASPDTYETYAGTAIPAGATDLYTYIGFTNRWYDLTALNNQVPITGTLGTAWQLNFAEIANFAAPYKFTFRNTGAPLICQ